jgi:hypothetical protein
VKDETWSEHNAVQASDEETQEKAERLAPLEEHPPQSSRQNLEGDGLIKVDTGSLKLPSDFTEKRDESSRLFGIEPITFFIMAFTLAFIAFIAFLISREPSKPQDEPAPAAVERQP